MLGGTGSVDVGTYRHLVILGKYRASLDGIAPEKSPYAFILNRAFMKLIKKWKFGGVLLMPDR